MNVVSMRGNIDPSYYRLLAGQQQGSLIGTFEAAQGQNPNLKSWNESGPVWGAPDGCDYSLVFNELADSMHRAVQKIMLSKADIKKTLDDAAAEVDRATAAYKKA